MKQQQEAREADFNKLVQPRGLGGLQTLSPRLDSLNPSMEGGRQDVNAIAGRRTDQFTTGGRSDFGGSSRNAGTVPSLPGADMRDFGDISSRGMNQPAYAPSPVPSAAPQGGGFGPKPFVFEMPRRKF
jgi:hypothetical protein